MTMREIKWGSYEIDKRGWGNGNPRHIGGFSYDSYLPISNSDKKGFFLVIPLELK